MDFQKMLAKQHILSPLLGANDQKKHLRTVFIAFVAATFFSFLAYGIGFNYGKDWKLIVLEFVVMLAMFFILGEFLHVLHVLEKIQERLNDGNKLIADISLENNVRNTLTQTVLSALEHDDTIVRKSISGALNEFLPTIVGNQHEKGTIELRSSYIATATYREFWRELVAYQEKHKDSVKIKICVSHATNLSVWNDKHLLPSHNRFIAAGGKVFRVLVRNANNPETTDQYTRVIKEMRDIGINVYYFDASASELITDDYILCRVEGVNYTVVWNADWEKGYGTVKECKISTNPRAVENIRNRWGFLVSMLMNQTTDLSNDIINQKPNASDLKEMNNPFSYIGESE